jgi:predicted sulfurtransferase
LTVQEFYDMAFVQKSVDLIIDVRAKFEFDEGHIENATHVNSMGMWMSMMNGADINETLKGIGIFPCLHCTTVCKYYNIFIL